MRVEQIHSSTQKGWCHLFAACPCSKDKHRIGGRLVLSQSPGRAKRFRTYPPSRHDRRR